MRVCSEGRGVHRWCVVGKRGMCRMYVVQGERGTCCWEEGYVECI